MNRRRNGSFGLALYRKRSPKLRFEFAPTKKQSTLGGRPALEALAQPFDLWHKPRHLGMKPL